MNGDTGEEVEREGGKVFQEDEKVYAKPNLKEFNVTEEWTCTDMCLCLESQQVAEKGAKIRHLALP